MLKGKIHRAVVKQAELNYVGSITVDPVLMQAAGILEYENVQIVDIENGNRFETYTIAGEPGSGRARPLPGKRPHRRDRRRAHLPGHRHGLRVRGAGHRCPHRRQL